MVYLARAAGNVNVRTSEGPRPLACHRHTVGTMLPMAPRIGVGQHLVAQPSTATVSANTGVLGLVTAICRFPIHWAAFAQPFEWNPQFNKDDDMLRSFGGNDECQKGLERLEH